MCGVVGYIGKKNLEKELIEMLKKLEYRGYDSSGIAYIENEKINIIKSAGKIVELENKLRYDSKGGCGIGHTRWATHGKPTDVNAHPHKSKDGSWSIVHNGIIENYLELKKDIINNSNVNFLSDTDTEVVVQLLGLYDCADKISTLIEVCKKLEGSFALCCLNRDYKDTLYLAKRKSPLYVAANNKEVFVASDPICFAGKTEDYYSLLDNEYCEVSVNHIKFFDKNHKDIVKNKIHLSLSDESLCKDNNSYFMLKEIKEEDKVLSRIVDIYKENNVFKNFTLDFLNKFNKVYIIGCGTAYHAGLMGEKFLEKFARLSSRAYIASEFRYSNPILDEKTLCVFVSQSGETADTLACLEMVKEYGCTTIALTNVLYSSLAKSVDIVLPVCAGPEIAVASTKAYSAQITIFYMLSRHLENIYFNRSINYFQTIENLSKNFPTIDKYNLEEVVDEITNVRDMFFIGRDVDYITITEGSLKLKEITYINSSAYPSGELKHGFLALIETGSYVFVLATQKELLDKTLNGANEAHSRGAKIILFTQLDLPKEKLSTVYRLIKLDNFSEELMPIVSINVFQYLSYLVSIKKGLNPDQPRNLAKSVTVE